jgi:hypothetical protein
MEQNMNANETKLAQNKSKCKTKLCGNRNIRGTLFEINK